jgi:ATP-dependent Clp protease ATP-binding subunit ClpC
VIEIESSLLLAGTGVRGSLAERFVQIKAEVAKTGGRVILFLDDFHVLLAEGGDEGVTELKTALGKGELVCIAATTEVDYKRTVLADAALARRFTAIEVAELSTEEAFLALEQVVPAFAKHHGVTFAPEALAASVTWSTRYLPGRALPDKAIGILDLAGARARRRAQKEVVPADVADVVSEMSGVPTERLLESDGERMLRLEELMARRIVGHTSALSRIAKVLRRNASGFRQKRPIGSFLLLGPTGVGKTETAKAIAECLFHSPHAMTRLDLSEYAEPHSIARLVGAPPGYVGHESGGQLTEAVARRPYQVILLDEIEKAHRDVLEAFLQVFDEGQLTDGRGRTVDFTSTVILLTSNLGADAHGGKSGRGVIGFGGHDTSEAAERALAVKAEERVLAAAKSALPPELLNRFDEVIAFAPLTRKDVREVAARMLASLGDELEKARGVRLDVGSETLDALLDQGGFDPEMGARPMRRAIGRLVETKLSEMLLRGELVRGDVATVEVEAGEIVIDIVRA